MRVITATIELDDSGTVPAAAVTVTVTIDRALERHHDLQPAETIALIEALAVAGDDVRTQATAMVTGIVERLRTSIDAARATQELREEALATWHDAGGATQSTRARKP